jgi:hypothetical protein
MGVCVWIFGEMIRNGEKEKEELTVVVDDAALNIEVLSMCLDMCLNQIKRDFWSLQRGFNLMLLNALFGSQKKACLDRLI